jgi:hypothetical protein
MTLIRAEVTEDDIRTGVRYAVDERHPIVKAARRALQLPPGRGWVGLGQDWLDICVSIGADGHKIYDLPMCADFIRDFDAGKEVYPFCFMFEKEDLPEGDHRSWRTSGVVTNRLAEK